MAEKVCWHCNTPLPEPEHQHRFTVAVEWIFFGHDGHRVMEEHAARTVVARLRCETCKEEITRG